MTFFDLVAPFKTPAVGYLVTQTFMRGHSPEFPEKKPILLTPYDDPDLARDHLAQICIDKYKAIINLAYPRHCSTLQTMDTPASPYLLYIATVNKPTAIAIHDHEGLTESILKFLSAHPKHRFAGPDPINAFMQLRHGEFYITLSVNCENITERLCVIEHSNLKESASTFPSQLILRV